jgi:hypothetical protein
LADAINRPPAASVERRRKSPLSAPLRPRELSTSVSVLMRSHSFRDRGPVLSVLSSLLPSYPSMELTTVHFGSTLQCRDYGRSPNVVSDSLHILRARFKFDHGSQRTAAKVDKGIQPRTALQPRVQYGV